MLRKNPPDPQGPKPLTVFLVLVGCILLLSMLFAALRVFVAPSLSPQPCRARGPLPDPQCSPGDVFPNATKEIICTKGYATSVRDVSQSLKDEVYARYGIAHHVPYEYEVDHIVSLELGGSNDIKNLYPEAAEPRPGYHEKDKIENLLHKMVCNGSMNLSDAQRIIATDWIVMLPQIGYIMADTNSTGT
jgi:hypothetical protein